MSRRPSPVKRFSLGVAALVLLGALTSACGGSGGSSSGTEVTDASRPLVKADWVGRADAVCAKARQGGGPETGTGKISVALLPKAANFLREEKVGLEEIPVPPGQSVKVERLIGQVATVAGLMAQEHEQFGGHGAPAPSEFEFDELLTTLGTPITAMNEGFLAYGADACGEATFGFPAG